MTAAYKYRKDCILLFIRRSRADEGFPFFSSSPLLESALQVVKKFAGIAKDEQPIETGVVTHLLSALISFPYGETVVFCVEAKCEVTHSWYCMFRSNYFTA
jgi:hypothetical protein